MDYCLLQSIESWSIKPEAIKGLEAYYILSWKTRFLQDRIKDSVGFPHRAPDGKVFDYFVLYHNCNKESILGYDEVLLSFRKPANIPHGYVMVRPKIGTEIYRG